MNQTNQQLLDRPDCVGTLENISCYPYASNKHDNLDTVLLIGGFITFIVVAIIIYKLKYGEKK